MGLDAVVIGSIASVIFAVSIIGVIAYKIIKQIGDNKNQD